LIDQVKDHIGRLQALQAGLEVEERRYNLARKAYSHFTDVKKARIEAIYPV